MTAYSPDHQALDALIRPNWEILHPIVQDFVYSWFMEIRSAEGLKKDHQKKLNAINNELTNVQKNSTAKIEVLNRKLNDLNSEFLNVENELNQKMEFVEELTGAIEDKEVGGEHLKQKMEERIRNMHERMIRQQEKFETTQIKIGNQFKNRVMELDEERLLLNEKIEKNKEILVKIEKENQELQKNNQLLKGFQNRIIAIKSILDSLPSNILTREGKKTV